MDFKRLYEIIEYNAFYLPNKIAIREISGREITYIELQKEIISLEKSIINCNLKNKHIAVIADNSINFIILFFLVNKLGGTCILLDINDPPFKIEETLEGTNSSIMLATKEYTKVLKELIKHDSIQQIGNSIFLCLKRGDLTISNAPTHRASVILSTSGSISQPKYVMHSDSSLIAAAFSHGMAVEYNQDDVALIILPLSFSFSLSSQLISVLLFKGSIIINPKKYLSINQIFKDINEHHVTSIAMISSQIVMWNRIEKVIDFPTLKKVLFAGGPSPKKTVIELKKKYDSILFLQGYGLTEAGPRVTIVQPKDYSVTNNSSGRSVYGMEVIVDGHDDHGFSVKQKIGEIKVKGKNIMLGYYNNPTETRKALNGGYLATGDIGYLDNNNELHIMGRKKNTIISSGITIYPEEVEEVLFLHHCIKDVLVIGEKDELLTELVIAYVVLKSPCEKEELIRHCKKHLSQTKIPKKIIYKERLDKTTTGKIIRRLQ